MRLDLLALLATLALALGACAPPRGDDDDDSTTDDDDADDDDADDDDADDDDADDPIDTVAEYVNFYCSEYAVPCGVYYDVASCKQELNEVWFDGCSVADVAALQTCVVWLGTLSCEYEGWIDECDDWLDCP